MLESEYFGETALPPIMQGGLILLLINIDQLKDLSTCLLAYLYSILA